MQPDVTDDHDARQAMTQVLLDWQQREVLKLTSSLPVEFTASALQWLRARACRHEDANIDCPRWQQYVQPPSELPDLLAPPSNAATQAREAGFSACHGCRRPALALDDVLERLNAQAQGSVAEARTWSSYARGEQSMKPDALRRVLAGALGNGWIDVLQVLSLGTQIEALEAANLALRRCIERAKDRRSFETTGELDVDRSELAREFESQLDQVRAAGVQRLRQRQASGTPLNLAADDVNWLLGEDSPGA